MSRWNMGGALERVPAWVFSAAVCSLAALVAAFGVSSLAGAAAMLDLPFAGRLPGWFAGFVVGWLSLMEMDMRWSSMVKRGAETRVYLGFSKTGGPVFAGVSSQAALGSVRFSRSALTGSTHGASGSGGPGGCWHPSRSGPSGSFMEVLSMALLPFLTALLFFENLLTGNGRARRSLAEWVLPATAFVLPFGGAAVRWRSPEWFAAVSYLVFSALAKWMSETARSTRAGEEPLGGLGVAAWAAAVFFMSAWAGSWAAGVAGAMSDPHSAGALAVAASIGVASGIMLAPVMSAIALVAGFVLEACVREAKTAWKWAKVPEEGADEADAVGEDLEGFLPPAGGGSSGRGSL